jgi:signal peptidase I
MSENFSGSLVEDNKNVEHENLEKSKEKLSLKERFRRWAYKVNLKREIFEWIRAFFFAYVTVVVLKTFVFALVLVDGESMEPTLYNSDRLYVNKLIYSPKRGDIVVFESDFNRNKPYVKRIIAVEGDTIFIDFNKGAVYLNDEVMDEIYIKDLTFLSEKFTRDKERIGEFSREKPIKVDKNYVFLMGDNRLNSLDSRAFGPVSVKDIIGRAVLRIWPNSGLLH